MSNTKFEVMFDMLTDSYDPTGPTNGNLYVNTVL